MFFAYFLIGLRLCHRTFLFLFRYDVQWYQRGGGTFAFSLFFLLSFFFFLFFLVSFLDLSLSSIFFYSRFFYILLFYFSTMKAHDFGGGMLFGYGYGCLFHVHGHSRIVTFSGTTIGSPLLVLFLMSQYVSSPINFVGSDILFF